MKFINKLLITTAILFYVSMIAMAKETSNFSVQSMDENTISLKLTKESQSAIQVTLRDIYGVIMHNETLSENNVNNRKYNLRNLPSGKYTLTVAYDDVLQIQKIYKQFDKIEIDSDNLHTLYHPTFEKHSEYFDLEMLSFSKQKINLKIRDDEGRIIYSEDNLLNGLFKKRFNLSKLDKGEYTISVRVVGTAGTVINKEFVQSIDWSPEIASL